MQSTSTGAGNQRWIFIRLTSALVRERCAALHVPDPRSERDALIAATALVHGMTVVTRNVVDFAPMGVAVFNPWDSALP